ncbi:hypothetical protein JT358_05865 [Micrococcales bacterium 31B]|nr:hypothetical protein [Micrococcales bacterium 31B]
MTPQIYVRYQSRHENRRGSRPGIFALANGLARDNRLSPDDHAWWLAANYWCNAAYADPSTRDPSVYDHVINPGARSWFKLDAAAHLLDRVAGYLDLLDRYGVAWQRLETTAPGRIVYEDDVQIVAVPE